MEKNYPYIKRHNYEGFFSEEISFNASEDFAEAFAEVIALDYLGNKSKLIKNIIFQITNNI